jgi:hypothetical protein
MRIKLGLLIFALVLISSLLTNYYIIGTLESDSKLKLQQEMRTSFLAYEKTHKVNAAKRIEIASKFAAEPDLIAAMNLPADTPEQAEEKHYKLYEKVEVISRLRYPGDLFIVTDAEGIELARTLVATWKKTDFSDNRLSKQALAGQAGEDLWNFTHKIMLVDAVPIRDGGKVIGLLLMCNGIDEELISEERKIATIARDSDTAGGMRSSTIVDGPNGRIQHEGLKYEVAFSDLAYFSADSVIKSSLSARSQETLNRFLLDNSQNVAEWLASKNKYFEKKIRMDDDVYMLMIAPFPTLQDDALVGYMMLRSETEWLKAYSGIRNFLMIFSLLLVMLGVSVSFLIIQKAYDAVDFILEGAHQIIVGNKDYQFASADEYLNQIGQTINLAIAILLGKYIPEDEEEANAMSLRGSLDTGKAGVSQKDRMLIETIDDNAHSKESGEVKDNENSEGYYDRLFDEFIAAKKSVGDDISQVTKQRMIAKLKRAEEKLIEKHGCVSVRFGVKIEQNKVTLKPTPIWK